jgi:hypothetical protein
MPIHDANKLFTKLEQIGEQQVRVKLAQGAFARNKAPLVELWLREKDIGSKDKTALSKTKDGTTMTNTLRDTNTWKDIEKDFDISKRVFGKKISFVTNPFKRKIIFRDIQQAHILAASGFSKPAIIMAGSVIEELLRIFLVSKGITPQAKTFDSYIRTCEANGLLKSAIHRLTDSVRFFRNLVHLEKEDSPKATISKATAKGAVASIFTIVNDF